jgi:SOS-response transcriptional repressor LexA
MAPALRDGDVVVARASNTPNEGDVVLVRWAARPAQLSVKRVRHRDGDGWFVTGDNAFGSTDSRELGPAAVVGVVRWRLWPRPGRVAPSGDTL